MSRRTARMTLAPDDPRHGTVNGYGNLKCRCDRCRAAWRVRHNAYMHRSGQLAVRAARARGVPIPYDVDALDARIAARDRQEPRTLQEWQFAADLAELALSLDAARQFGLITGGPNIHRERADQLIEEARLRLIEPAPSDELTSRFIESLRAPAQDEEQ